VVHLVGCGGPDRTVKTRADDPFTRRVRLTAADQVDHVLLDILAVALEQNS
jgi:hypothetical protein